MANSIWTIEEFTCAGCSMNYTATREEHAEAHSGSFKCSICSGVVHSWSGKHHFFGWQAVKTKPRVRTALGRRCVIAAGDGLVARSSCRESSTLPHNGLRELRLLLLCGTG